MVVHINPKTWDEILEELNPLEVQGVFCDNIICTHRWLPEDVIVMRSGDMVKIIRLAEKKPNNGQMATVLK